MAITLDNNTSFRDRIPTVTEKGKRRWIFAWKPDGRLYRFRKWLSYFYIVAFFVLPYLHINGNPLFLLNVVEGRFSIFGMVFWPQDFFVFGIAMVTFVVFIVLFTMVYGRVFCGWACPQTIFMEMLFRRIEWLVEGNPNQQKLLNGKKWQREKIVKKITKHTLFFVLSFLIANTFLMYIIGSKGLFEIISEPISEHVGGFIAILFFTVVFYSVYAYAREIICTVVCPYGRLQGVLLDKNSMMVAYDYNRGEPRAKGKRPNPAVGDCIDCGQCVGVCPTGIDIRNGVQLECINCTACIDACNNIMQKLNLQEGLIRIASENEISAKKPFRFTAKMKSYSVILILLLTAMIALIATRSAVDAKVLRAKGQMYQEVGSDSLSNLYNVMLVNKTHHEVPIVMKLENIKGTISYVGKQHTVVPKEGQAEALFFIVLDKKSIQSRETNIVVGIYKDGKRIKKVATSFLGYTE
jgi:cytochrome c oxidase accessory protein FixG